MSYVKLAIKKQKKSFVSLLLLAGITAAVIVAQAYFLVAVIEGVFLQGATFKALIPLLAGLLIVFLMRALSGYGIGAAGVTMGINVKREFRNKLFKKLSENPIQASVHSQSGKKTSLLLDT